MDGVNINKYFGQFNPILIVPVLSAVIGAILVFVFGFKQANGPRFQTGSNTDSLKRSKKKANGTKQQDTTAHQSSKVQNAQSTKVNKKIVTETVAIKKIAAANEKPIVKKKDENKKTEDKGSENDSPAKKVTSVVKKSTKDSSLLAAVVANKKQKSIKKTVADEREPKPAGFDDGGWFTVQSKGNKKSTKTDETGAKGTENASPPQAASKTKSKSAKIEKTVEKKAVEQNNAVAEGAATAAAASAAVATAAATAIAATAAIVIVENEEPTPNVFYAASVDAEPIVESEPVVSPVVETTLDEETVVAAKPTAVPPKEIVADVVTPVENSTLVFDELGDWTDAKPDRKKGNKKKTRKD